MTTYAMDPRQKRLYQHSCSVYRRVRTVDGTSKKPNADTFELAAAGVPAYYEYTGNTDGPAGVGTLKAASIFTRDVVHMPYTAPAVNDCYLVNTTILPNGQPCATFGEIHVVQGDPLFVHPSGRMASGKLSVQCMTDDQPPAVLVTAVNALRAAKGLGPL